MIQIKCNGCGRVVEVKEKWDRNATCNNCHNYFSDLRPIKPNPNNIFSNLGNQMQSHTPHIYLGGNGLSNRPTPPNNVYTKPIPQPVYPSFKTKEQLLYDKITNWGFIVAIVLVLGYATFRIITSLIK